jgi:type 1 glutamine amidotransferase/sugar phosphate isomerase/epimerase
MMNPIRLLLTFAAAAGFFPQLPLCAQTTEERAFIEAAAPASPLAKPRSPRNLLIFTLNVGYGGHPSINYANEAFTLMGKKTGAFATHVTNDPAVFARESLSRYDAVLFNNTVGNCFTNADLRRNLQEFVTGGGGLMGLHGTTVAFTRWPGAVEDWPEFGYMIGARGAAHKQNTEPVWVKVEETVHPLTSFLPSGGFEFKDEFFRYQDIYSRDRLRVLLSIDMAKTPPDSGNQYGHVKRQDNDYALAWIRNYGRGRVFHSTIAHNPYVFWDKNMLRFYLAAAQFALGDLAAPTMPSAHLTPATRAWEKLGWKLGIEAYTFHKFSLFETFEKTRGLGLPYVGGLSFQRVSTNIPKMFDPQLSDVELEQVRLKMEENGLRMLTYYIQDIPNNEAEARKIFEFGRKMGIETFMTEPKIEALDLIEKLADEYGINVALHNHDQKASPAYWNPESILKVCNGRSARLGAAADIGYWIRAGVDPIQGIRLLKDRLITLQMHDLNSTLPDAHDVPWGKGQGGSAEIFETLKQLNVKPTMIGLEYSYNWMESLPEIRQCIEFFNTTAIKLAESKEPVQ